MPYIKESDRTELLERNPRNAGELNYALTLQLIEYFNTNGSNYACIHDIKKGVNAFMRGDMSHELARLLQEVSRSVDNESMLWDDSLVAAELAFAEFYRRKVAPYEDKKIQENGDVY